MINNKIVSREDLSKILIKERAGGKKIGFTSGVFDILHAGHVTFLEQAKSKCDILVVGINSDDSVKAYKGEKRPLVGEEDRLKVVAAINSVDYVFLFEERRNAKNIELLQPDYYFKAGDYTPDQLTSAGVVKDKGGEAIVLPAVDGISTSKFIEKILKLYGSTSDIISVKEDKRNQNKAVFLDRDGVVNKDVEYLHEPEKFVFEKNALAGMKKIQELGFKIVIVTMQAGIGLGYFTKEDFYKVNRVMLKECNQNGIIIDKIYFCPHSKRDNCDCRKPKTGLFERGKEELDLDIGKCFVVGDKTSDILAGYSIGSKTIGMKTGHACLDKEFDVAADFMANDLLDAADYISKNI